MGKYFTVEELCVSAVARSRGIDNAPPPQAVAALHDLIGHLLDPLREAWGGPVVVNSGYRSPALNAAVGGAPRSRHMYGEAADITVPTPLGNIHSSWKREGAVIKMRLSLPQGISATVKLSGLNLGKIKGDFSRNLNA